jgi:hypothetical protein
VEKGKQVPKVGDIGLVKIGGNVGQLIRFGQWIAGGGFENYEHAFIVIDVPTSTDLIHVVGAEPGGARSGFYSQADTTILWSNFQLTDAQRTALAAAAQRYIGTPYSFLDYVALALHRLHVPVPLLKRYISSTRHMICSQLVDQCYQDAGVHLFNDGRWPGYVMPADLYKLIEKGQQ